MTQLERLINTFTLLDFSFVVLKSGGYTYVALCSKEEVESLKKMNPDNVYDKAMFEFDENERWASYP